MVTVPVFSRTLYVGEAGMNHGTLVMAAEEAGAAGLSESPQLIMGFIRYGSNGTVLTIDAASRATTISITEFGAAFNTLRVSLGLAPVPI